MIGDTELKVAKLYDMLPEGAGTTSEGRTAADNATVRSVFVIGPDKKIKPMLTYPMSTGRNFDEVLRVLDSLPAHGEAQGRDAGELEAGRGRHHRPGGHRRRREGEVSQRLEGAQALPADRAATRTDTPGRPPPAVSLPSGADFRRANRDRQAMSDLELRASATLATRSTNDPVKLVSPHPHRPS